MRKFLLTAVLLSVAAFGQAPPVRPHTPATTHQPVVNSNSGIDTVIELVKGGMSESDVIESLQSEGKAYSLLPADLLRLHKAGVSENIIKAMKNPKAPVPVQATAPAPSPETAAPKDATPGGSGPAPAPPPPAEAPAAVVTPFPPDLPDVSPVHKRRLIVVAFDYSTVRNWVQYWFGTNANIGQGIRAMLASRLQQSPDIMILERHDLNAVLTEQQRQRTSPFDPATRIVGGHVLGAEYIVTGEIVLYGRDDTTRKTDVGGVLAIITHGKVGGGETVFLSKNDKAVVGISFRMVNVETSENILTGEARGESSRKSKDYSGLLGGFTGKTAGLGRFANSMDSTNFSQTIIGEATSDAVNKIVKQLEEKISQIPAKPRNIEGRVAVITANGVDLALGKNDGVLLGDRFEIKQINNEVIDPRTKEVIGVEAVKVGELVVTDVQEKLAIGNYGGQSLSADYINGKGYQALLMSK